MIAGWARRSRAKDLIMATLTLAQAVLEHAHQFYDVGLWYVVAECWDVWAVLEELDRHEERAPCAFDLEAAAIAHFGRLIAPG